MLPVKLPYYPKIEATMRETRFGAVEISVPRIYNQPLANKVIARVDTLECLREQFGDEPFICRELIYTILAGEHELYDVNNVFASYYRKYRTITEYVNEKYYYGDDSIPMLERCILPLRNEVNSYRDDVLETFTNAGGKYLVQTHDFIYFAFTPNAKVPDMKGVKVIC